MKTLVYVLALVFLGTSGAVKAQASNERPLVTLANGNITVDPPTLRFQQRGAKPIRWELPAGADYVFTGVGIVIDREVVSETDLRAAGQGANQQQVVGCQRVENGRAFQCQNSHSQPGIYKYTINLQQQNRTFTKDPVIVNR
jgi:hypothetical protein